MNNTEIKEPLYKVLNEKRTQGIWDKQGPKIQERSGQTYYTIHSKSSFDVIGFLYPHSDEKGSINHVNIDYINLAVNNLHHLAEALQPFIKLADAVLVDTLKTSESPLYGYNDAILYVKDLIAVKQALSRIS